ncbi:MAG: hypothetical protein HXY34_10535 [Candidatus Thorarchaeota archaeon]|nr:hypothetical protein [Candidatus Thorarchaeota archaeon]
MVFDFISPINAGFMASVMVFVIYWSLTLTSGAIIERAGEHGLRFFGSIPRVAVTHCAISLAIGCPSLIVDPASLFDYLVTNLIAMPVLLIVGIYVLKSTHVDLQLALWRHSNSMKKAALDEDQFIHSLTELIQGMHGANRLESFVRAYVEMNPSMVPVLRTATQKLEAESKVPTNLSVLLAGLLAQQ